MGTIVRILFFISLLPATLSFKIVKFEQLVRVCNICVTHVCSAHDIIRIDKKELATETRWLIFGL